MITRRRLTLQITPILDMLLIVLFMQFLDIKERAAALEAQASTSAASVAEMGNQLKVAETAATDAQKLVDRVQEQQAAVARMLGEVFRLTPDETKKFVQEMKAPNLSGPSSAVEAQLKEFADGSPEPILQHLLTYDEIRKRCDVWELFIDAQNVAHLNTGDRERELRVNLSGSEDADIERFSVELETAYRSLPQPKHLVILMLTYDRGARLTVTEGISAALPKIVDRLTNASTGLTRFEYADLGVRRVPVTGEK
jgi:hypothetical protein